MPQPMPQVGRLALLAAAVACYATSATAAALEAAASAEDVVALDEQKRSSGPYLLRWGASPEKCLDVWGDHAGAGLQLWDCADLKGAGASDMDDLHFLVPAADATGWIQWVTDPTLCLNAPSHGALQLWYCHTSPEEHILWHVSGDGRAQLYSSSPARCLSVDDGAISGGAAANGAKVVLGDCEDQATFLIDNHMPDHTVTQTVTATRTSTRTATTTGAATSTHTVTLTTTETTTATKTSTRTATMTATATTTATTTETATVTTTATATVRDIEEDAAHYLQWRGSPGKCVDVWGDKAGAMLQLWDCADLRGAGRRKNASDLRFVLPAKGSKGWIQWASDPTLCLDAPEKTEVQLWYCITAPEENTNWEVSSDGQIRLAEDPKKCLRVRKGVARNGHKVQLGDCLEEEDASRDDAETAFLLLKELPESPEPERHNASQSGGNLSEAAAAEGVAASFIRWRGAPKQCVDVWGDHAGAVLQLWDCEDLEGADVKSEDELKFLLPEDEEKGFIRWAAKPELCLNAPEGHELQLWYCDAAPAAHTVWRVRRDGRIHLVEDPDKCLIVPGGVSKNGHKLKLWDCMRHSGPKHQMHAKFLAGDAAADAKTTRRTTTTRTTTHPPPESCAWSKWSEWSECDTTCHRYQARRIARRAAKGGKDCEGYSTRFEPCGPGLCRGTV